MARYRKKPIVVEAEQFHQLGDAGIVNTFGGHEIASVQCEKCGKLMGEHGIIGTLEDDHIACPGDWIITNIQCERYSRKPDIFAATYEEVKE